MSAEGALGRPSTTCPSSCGEVAQGSLTAHSSSFQPVKHQDQVLFRQAICGYELKK
jgi:uncharacterized protein involved in propanediol utilization